MIDSFPRRQHSLSLHHLQPTDLPSPAPSEPSFFENLPYSISTPSPAEFQRSLKNQYFDISTSYPRNFPGSPYSEATQHMSSDFQSLNPSIRVQQSTPTPTPIPQFGGAMSPQPSMDMAGLCNQQDWQMFEENSKQFNVNALQDTRANRQFRGGRNHRREHSSSSVGSSGPASPYDRTTTFPHIANTDQSPQAAGPFDGFSGPDDATTYSKPLPTPTQTPTNTSFLMPHPTDSYYGQGYSEPSTAHLAVKQVMMDHHTGADDDAPAFSHSARHSVSSFSRESPATPRSSNNDYDDYRALSADFSKAFPKLDRTMSDACQDELYNPVNATAAPPPPAKKFKPNTTPLSPMRKNLISERLQQAERVRSQSPATTSSTGPIDTFPSQHLPFDFRSPASLLGTAAGSREQQKAQFEGLAMRRNHLSPSRDPPSKTISPKDALLDYQSSEDDQMPLFTEDSSADYSQDYSQSQWSSDHDQQPTTSQGFRSMVSRQPHNPAFATSGPPQSNFSFNVPSTMSTQPTPGYPFPASSYRRAPTSTSGALEPTPEFPAHLTSMESSISEAEASNPVDVTRPPRTTADTGTYSCTYHGCPMRFDNPQKLQKHKREGHRSVHHPLASLPGRAGSSDEVASSGGSSMTSEALLARNSQAGPHKCERINPSTGKPCNTIFSRPYDLTRHEDTIHNARKQKVRCALCVEEKTFSRNDALTRHMRVVHPEVDFPGKHRRRGGH